MSFQTIAEESRQALLKRRAARDTVLEAPRLAGALNAKALDGGLSQPQCPTNADSGPVSYAAAPASSKTPLPARSRARENGVPELTFRDEERLWNLRFASRCPVCGYGGALQRRFRLMLGRHDYRMKCSNPRCGNATDWFPNSQDAIQVWRLAAALVK